MKIRGRRDERISPSNQLLGRRESALSFTLVLRLCGITPTSWETNCDFRRAFTSVNCPCGHSRLLTILTLNGARLLVGRKHRGTCLSLVKLNVTAAEIIVTSWFCLLERLIVIVIIERWLREFRVDTENVAKRCNVFRQYEKTEHATFVCGQSFSKSKVSAAFS